MAKVVTPQFSKTPFCIVLYKKLVDKTLDIPDPKPISQTDTTPLPHVIVGDEAFGLSENVMRPYCGKSLTASPEPGVTLNVPLVFW